MAQYPNLYNVELTKGPAVVQLEQMFLGDVLANRIGAIVTENGEAVTLGGTCSGTAILANGGTVPISGTVSGNTCYIDLSPAAYAVEGPVEIFVTNVSGGKTTTLVAAFGNVRRKETGTVIDPGTIIPSVSALIDAIDAAVASIPADYSALLAAVAPTFSASNNYTAGRYVWNSGNLYRFTADHAAGSWTGTDAVQVVVTNEIADLKSAINYTTTPVRDLTVIAQKEAGTETLPEGFSTGNGYIRDMTVSSPGSISSNSSSRWFSFYVSEEMDVYVPLDKSDIGSSRQICVYNSNGPHTNNRVTPVYASNNQNYPLPTENTPLHVLAGQCVAWSYYLTGLTLERIRFVVYKSSISGYALADSIALTSTMNSEVDTKISDEDTIIRSILNNGYYRLDESKWARRAWDDGGTSIDNRQYRVRYTEPLTFDRVVYGVVQQGFTVAAYADGAFLESSTVRTFAPGVTYKIYIRRFTEDFSEVADVSVFANAIKFSTSLAPIELYKPTFTDVSMFERVGICGDSYASGGGIISGIRSLTWGKNLERQAGITVDIYAKSGQNVMQWVVDSTNGLPALLAGNQCGLYWLQHGINGTSTDAEFGSLEDITTYPHPNTFCGQYTEAIEQIKTAFPKARIIMATIIGSSFGLYQSTYAKVNNAIRAIAQHCEVMVVDVADDDFYRSPWYLNWTRSNHPTAMQNAGIAMANRRLISKCIQDNPDYFVNYGT